MGNWIRLRFTLRAFLLVSAFGALVLSHVITSQRLRRTEDELIELRKEAGYLTIDDDARIHAVRLPTLEALEWRWRLYLPPGRSYGLYALCGDQQKPPRYGVPQD